MSKDAELDSEYGHIRALEQKLEAAEAELAQLRKVSDLHRAAQAHFDECPLPPGDCIACEFAERLRRILVIAGVATDPEAPTPSEGRR